MIGIFSSTRSDHPMADLKEAKRLLAALPAEPDKALDEVTHWLESVTAETTFKPESRAQLVQLIDEAGQVPARKLARDYLGASRICLTGVGSGGRTTGLPAADVAAEMVLQNNVIVGSVNANKRHWYKAAQVLAKADRGWLARLISRREPPEAFMRALRRQPDDIKVVIQFSEA